MDYDKMFFLDAENLAEQGILEAYKEIKGDLSKYIREPASLEEILDDDLSSYKVTSQGIEFEIYSPDLEEGEGRSWGRATFALFQLVNSQLQDAQVKFYALYGGNDLGGIFLTQEEYESAISSLPRKTDWPYLPTQEHPWYGQPN